MKGLKEEKLNRTRVYDVSVQDKKEGSNNSVINANQKLCIYLFFGLTDGNYCASVIGMVILKNDSAAFVRKKNELYIVRRVCATSLDTKF